MPEREGEGEDGSGGTGGRGGGELVVGARELVCEYARGRSP